MFRHTLHHLLSITLHYNILIFNHVGIKLRNLCCFYFQNTSDPKCVGVLTPKTNFLSSWTPAVYLVQFSSNSLELASSGWGPEVCPHFSLQIWGASSRPPVLLTNRLWSGGSLGPCSGWVIARTAHRQCTCYYQFPLKGTTWGQTNKEMQMAKCREGLWASEPSLGASENAPEFPRNSEVLLPEVLQTLLV